jgi:hypothetical protein
VLAVPLLRTMTALHLYDGRLPAPVRFDSSGTQSGDREECFARPGGSARAGAVQSLRASVKVEPVPHLPESKTTLPSRKALMERRLGERPGPAPASAMTIEMDNGPPPNREVTLNQLTGEVVLVRCNTAGLPSGKGALKLAAAEGPTVTWSASTDSRPLRPNHSTA